MTASSSCKQRALAGASPAAWAGLALSRKCFGGAKAALRDRSGGAGWLVRESQLHDITQGCTLCCTVGYWGGS